MTAQALSPSIIRMLHDKLYEKRKVAALEIEKLVRGYANNGNNAEIQRIVTILAGEFSQAQNANSRKGGLIGLAACAIALGNQNIQGYLESLLKPVLICSADPDSRMRYFACESLYNIVKVARADTLPYFSELFDALSKLSADQDPNVRNGSDLLDRLLKDIVTESRVFDVATFVVLLRDRLYTKNQYTRRFLVQWLTCVMSIPETDILAFLPEFLDALFPILDDSSKEIRTMCQSTLGEFLSRIEKNPEKVDFNSLVNIVVTHSQSTDALIKETALLWVYRLVILAGSVILGYTSGILGAILPTLAYEESTIKNVRETAKRANQALMNLITHDYDKKEDNNKSSLLPLVEMVEVFSSHLRHKSTSTKCAVIRWITHLLVQTPYSIFEHIEKIFPAVMKMLADPADDVVILTLECLSEIASSPAGPPMERKMSVASRVSVLSSPHGSNQPLVLNTYFNKFISHLIHMFRTDVNLLEARSSFIIRQLCTVLNAENVFRAIGEALDQGKEAEEDPRFCSHAVKKLNSILITSTELEELRETLKNDICQENSQLFCCLYKSWCHNPVASVTLCLLTQNYRHCCRLFHKFSDFNLDVELLIELDKLVHLLESPIFAYLRLQLLEVPCRQFLIKSLYSLLMLLPQSRSFDTLHQRLNCVPSSHLLPPLPGENAVPHEGNHLKEVNFDELFDHFVQVQTKHAAFKRTKRIQATSSSI
ncbi:protein VAC14 homolog [Clavelina lepadiformis]|uniref:protein VAC14 homolog n=1 Tax=Clavelina lepadiformis TaxID=159417 RepID=UPI0040427739